MIGKRNGRNAKAVRLMKPDYKTPQFTPREKEIMTWTAQGKTSLQISELLTVSEPAVKKHIKSACLKLGANNKTHAIAIAVTLGLIAAVHPIQSRMDET
jgi:LuxR family transcriptional regulator, quorum-sensing system regulator BjaR1